MDAADPRNDCELMAEALCVQDPAAMELRRVPLQLFQLRFRVCADRTVHPLLLVNE
jgi:hypothetical protein